MEREVYPKFRWFVFVTMIFATIAQGSNLISFAPMIGVISKETGLSLGETTGILMGAFTLCVSVSTVIGGIVIDRIGIAKTYIIGTSLMLVGMVLTLFTGANFLLTAILRIVQGIGGGPIMASVSAVALNWFAPKVRGIITGIQGTALTLGTAIGLGMVSGVFQATNDWRIAVVSVSVFAVIAFVLSVIYLFGPKPPAAKQAESGADVDHDFQKALRQAVTYIGILCIFALSWVMQAVNDLTPGYFAIRPPVGVGFGPVLAGQFMVLVQVGFLLGSTMGGVLLEKVFKGIAKPVIMIGFIMVAIFSLSIKFPFIYSERQILLPCLCCAGFFQGFVVPSCLAFAAKHYPQHIVGKLGGLWMGVGFFGGTVGVIVGSTFLHFTKSYQASINTVALVALAGFIFAWFLNPPQVYQAAKPKKSLTAHS